ncbi:MAG: DUF4491 family protein [Bacteroidales bacterium]|nr:DUF4491 family protein [Bacteroidales bacterium]
MNYIGIIIGAVTFLCIGLFHPLVIKVEYYFGTKLWWAFLFVGLAAVIVAITVDNVVLSSLLGVFGFSSFWSIYEVFEQKRRVEKGWFPKNPKREKEYRNEGETKA